MKKYTFPFPVHIRIRTLLVFICVEILVLFKYRTKLCTSVCKEEKVSLSEFNRILALNEMYRTKITYLRQVNSKLRRKLLSRTKSYRDKFKVQDNQYLRLSKRYADTTAKYTGVPVLNFRFQDLFVSKYN